MFKDFRFYYIIHSCFLRHLNQWKQVKVKINLNFKKTQKTKTHPLQYQGWYQSWYQKLFTGKQMFTLVLEIYSQSETKHMSQKAELGYLQGRENFECQETTQSLLEPSAILKSSSLKSMIVKCTYFNKHS